MKSTGSYGPMGWIGLLTVVLIATGAACPAQQAQEPAFLKNATRVEIPGMLLDAPRWLSPSQFVAVWQADTSAKEVIYRYDLTTRTLTRLDALTNLVRNAASFDNPAANMGASDRKFLEKEEQALEKERTNASKKFYREGPQTESLWVSNLDGSNMKCLGKTTYEWHSGPLPTQRLAYGLRWIPGGRLSFLYDWSFYTLPIE